VITVLTGATGLIGRALGPELVKRGHTVRALVRDPKRAKERLNFPCEIFAWSGWEVPPSQAMKGASALIHLAGENVVTERWTDKRKSELRKSRIQTAAALSRGVKDNLEVFLTASGIGYYGDCADEVLTETANAGSDFLAQLCAEWEAASEKIHAERHLAMRFGAVLAKDEGFLATVVPMFKRFGASRLGNGQAYLAWIHVDDAVQILANAIENQNFRGVYNVCAPEPLKNEDMTEILRQKIGAWKGPPAPAFALKLLYGELSGTLLGSQRAKPKRLLEEGYKFAYPDFKSALDRIFSPR